MFINQQIGRDAVQQNSPNGGGVQGIGNGLLNFLKSPESLALAQGLLAGSQPSMTTPSSFGGALAQGLGNMQDRGDKEREKERLQSQLEIARGHLDVDRGKLDLDRLSKKEAAAQKAAQQQLLMSLLGGGGQGGVGGLGAGLPSEQQQRAATLAAGGFIKEAFEVLTEKDPTATPSASTITASQEQLRSLDSAIPALERLKTLDAPDIGGYPGASIVSSVLNPKEYSVSQKTIKDVAKDYLSAKQTNITDASIKAAVDVLSKAPGESQEEYNQRIDGIIEDLNEKRSYAASVVKPVRDVKKSAAASGMVTIRNPKTGETRRVTQEEADKLTGK